MAYQAIVKWRGKSAPVQKHKHARKGMRFPAPNQTFGKPVKSKKIVVKYGNHRLRDLRNLNSWLGFWNIRRIGGFLFNQRGPNLKWAKKWTKALGVQARIPYPLAGGEYALGEGIVSDGATVTVERELGKWCQLRPYTVVRLYEVEIGSGKKFRTSYQWRLYPDEKTGEIWIEKRYLEKVK